MKSEQVGRKSSFREGGLEDSAPLTLANHKVSYKRNLIPSCSRYAKIQKDVHRLRVGLSIVRRPYFAIEKFAQGKLLASRVFYIADCILHRDRQRSRS
jgi:hypothetical protein